jgi:hypothetical protein
MEEMDDEYRARIRELILSGIISSETEMIQFPAVDCDDF